MDTNAIINAAMSQLVDTVADAVIRKLKAEGTAQAALEPEALAAAIVTTFRDYQEVREIVRDIATDAIDNTSLSDDDEFQSLQRDVERLSEKVEELDPAVIDADNTDFDAAVMQVLRNNI